MAKVTIPKHAGQFHVSIASARNYLVTNDRTGKNEVTIPCINRAQAEELCRRLNAGEHDGEVNVPNRVKRR